MRLHLLLCNILRKQRRQLVEVKAVVEGMTRTHRVVHQLIRTNRRDVEWAAGSEPRLLASADGR